MPFGMNLDWMTVSCLQSYLSDLIGGRIYGPGDAGQATSTPDQIVQQAYKFLEKNLITGTNKEYGFEYSFSMPSSYKYGPSQWLWGTFIFCRC